MATTIGFQRRTVRSASGVAEYVVETYVDSRGDLPDKGVFLMEILDSANPARDTLARISNVADVTDYVTDRIEAVAAGNRFFRSAVSTNAYTNVDVALAAAEIIKDNVNLLVNAYQRFNTDFSTLGIVGPPDDYAPIEWPLLEESLKTRLTEEYTAIKEDRQAKEEEITSKEATCEGLTETLERLENEKSFLLEIQAAVAGLSTSVTSTLLAVGTAFTQGEALANALPAGFAAYEADIGNNDIIGGALVTPTGSATWFRDPDPTASGETDEGTLPPLMRAANAAFIDGRSAQADLGNKATLVSQKAALIDGLVSAKDAEITDTRTESETCASELVVLSTELQTLQNQEALALEALQDVCPDFEPSSS